MSNTDQGIRTWFVKLSSGVSFPFFQTTRRDHTEDQLHTMMPKKGSGYLVPVVGGIPSELVVVSEYHNGRAFVYAAQADLVEMWYKDDLPPAQHLKLYDIIQASTTEST